MEQKGSIQDLLDTDFDALLISESKRSKKRKRKIVSFVVAIIIVSGAFSFAAIRQERLKTYQQTYQQAVERMGESMGVAYMMLNQIDNDLENVKELKEYCESYIPYCGKFEAVVDNVVYSLESEFFACSDGTVMWKPATPKNQKFTLTRNGGVYYFFERSLQVSDTLEVSEKVLSYTATIRFEDGDIFYTVEGLDGEIVKSRHYIRVD